MPTVNQPQRRTTGLENLANALTVASQGYNLYRGVKESGQRDEQYEAAKAEAAKPKEPEAPKPKEPDALSSKEQAELQPRMVPPGTKGAREFAAQMPDGSVGRVWLAPPQKETGLKAPDQTKVGSVPGFSVAPGAVPTHEDAKQVKAAGQAALSAQKNISDLRAMVQTHGTETFGPNADQMNRLITDLKFQYKDIAGLGVLSEQDMEELGKLVPDTTKLMQRNSTALANLDQFEALLNSKLAAAAQTRGFVPAGKTGDTKMAGAPKGHAQEFTLQGKPVAPEQLKSAALMELQRRQGMAGVPGTSGRPN